MNNTRTWTIVAGAVAALLLAWGNPQTAEACGYKIVLKGPSLNQMKFHRAAHPGRILVYKNAMPRSFSRVLKKVGHKVDVVSSPQAASQALQKHRYNVILVAEAQQKDVSGAGAVVVVVDPKQKSGHNFAIKRDVKRVSKNLKVIEKAIKKSSLVAQGRNAS